MVENSPHPLVLDPPHGAIWKRSENRARAFRPKTHAEMVVLLATQGSATYLIDGALERLTPGTLLWALAGQSHFLVQDDADFDMWVLLISEKLLPKSLRNSPEMPPLSVDDRPSSAPARRMLEPHALTLNELADKLRDTFDATVLGVGLQWWLSQAWGFWQKAEGGVSTAVHPAVDRAAVALRNDPSLSWDEVSKIAALSPGRLSRLFKAQIGQSPVRFRNEKRLEQVDQQIASGSSRDLLSAALDAGFGSYSQFFRVFQDLRKTSPRSYYTPGRRDDI